MRAVIKTIVNACSLHAWLTLAVSTVIGLISAVYTYQNFAITTDITNLLAPNLEWRQRELAFSKAFPERFDTILAVVDAPTPELADLASAALVQRLSGQTEYFRSVQDLAGGPFFKRNAFLYLPTDEVARATGQLTEAEPLIQVLASDPSLRGLTQALSFGLMGVQAGHLTLDDLTRPLNAFSAPLEDVLAGRPATFSWRELMSGEPAKPSELRHIIEIHPVLDYSALEPGKAASDAIRRAAADLDLATEYKARVRLTGPVPIADEEFATVQENALINGIGTVVIVLVILWFALRSARIIVAVFITLAIGLAITAALGLMMVGALNLISVAFAVLFVGIGVDFGIQYSVRYRQERHENNDLHTALVQAGGNAGVPLTLAAAATAAGFLSFLPTAYRGVSELGQIAGVGMIIAFLASVTVLPALLMLLNPSGEREPLGFLWLAPVDRFLDRNRTGILIATAVISIGGLPLLYFLQFDFNPMNLRSPKVESIATFLDLGSDPAISAYSIDVLAPSLQAAQPLAERLAKLPEVSRVMTLESFVPSDQDAKRKLVEQAAKALLPALEAPEESPPTDAQNVEASRSAANDLEQAASGQTGPGAEAAWRLASVSSQLSNASEAVRARAEDVLVTPLKVALEGLRASLHPDASVSVDTLPQGLAEQWVTRDGRARIEVVPRGDPNDNESLRQFARAVLAIAPAATGGPISILESGDTIVWAFMEAGAWALVSISILLWITLRRIGDVLLTLVPLILAGAVTLEICVLIGLKLNFANIIALPLLLGIGVAFKIYYIMAWRAGQTDLLQSSLTRAVFFSAMTTATAFGSLWLSSHPGTSSMGKLLALSLVCTMAAAVLFQPVLMGPPRQAKDA